MRGLSLFVGLILLVGTAQAQDAIQSGKVKHFDSEKGLITITTIDGKDVECAIGPETLTRGADGKEIPDFSKKGVPIGTAVNFKVQQNGGRLTLVGLRLAAIGANQPKAGGQRAKAEAKAKANANANGKVPAAAPPRDSIGVKPLSELGQEKYKGESGGLYGNGSNAPPAAHQEAAKSAAAKIQPLDADGKPSPNGKIGLLSVGMSNTTQEFSLFLQLANADPTKSAKVAIVDGAQGGKAAAQWTDPASEVGKPVWATVDQRLKAADVSSAQVQVVWIKQALIQQGLFGEFPAHAKKFQADLVAILQQLKKHFPNLQLAYMSSRIYAGYATTPLNPEPYAFEGAFSVRWVIDSQIRGDSELNYDSSRGEVNSPVVLWGPYLWGDGVKPRQDGLVWTRDDLSDRDGTHPSQSGRKKVADLLMAFFHSDPYAKSWYLK